jgi:hypothetical protein
VLQLARANVEIAESPIGTDDLAAGQTIGARRGISPG